MASSFHRRLYLPCVFTRSPFAAEWKESEHPTLGSKCVSNRGSSAQYPSALSAMLLALIYGGHIIKMCRCFYHKGSTRGLTFNPSSRSSSPWRPLASKNSSTFLLRTAYLLCCFLTGLKLPHFADWQCRKLEENIEL